MSGHMTHPPYIDVIDIHATALPTTPQAYNIFTSKSSFAFNLMLIQPPTSLLAIPYVTAHPSTANVPITILRYKIYNFIRQWQQYKTTNNLNNA